MRVDGFRLPELADAVTLCEHDACWNQIRDRDGQKLSASEEVKELLGIPSRYEVLCVTSLGHKGEKKSTYRDADLDFGKVHFGKF